MFLFFTFILDLVFSRPRASPGVSLEIYMLPDKNVDFLEFYVIITGITSLIFEKFLFILLYMLLLFLSFHNGVVLALGRYIFYRCRLI